MRVSVEAVTTTLFEYPLKRRRGDAHSPGGRTHQNGLLVQVIASNGLVGISIAAPSCAGSLERLKARLLGEDPRNARGITQALVAQVFKLGNVGQDNTAIGALDIALWDLKGKIHGEPLWRLFGAREPRVLGYASGGDMCLSDEQLAAFYTHMAGLGFRFGKLKIGLDVDDDIRRLGIVRDALGKAARRPGLMVDASEYWSAKQAVRRITEMEAHFDLTWVEEPVSRFDYRGLKTVSDHIRSPVAAGENLDNVHQFLPYLEHGGVDIMQFGAGMTGITGAFQVAELANAYHLPAISSDSAGKYMAHVAAALPNHMMLEVHDDEVEEPMIRADNRIDDGWIVLGEAPGLGLEVDADLLAKYAVEKLQARSGHGWAGRRPGAGLVEVPATAEEKRIGASPAGDTAGVPRGA